MHATEFLTRLGLDQTADERAIKRAYARELKLIDQVADAAGFQRLRDAYETALAWLKHSSGQAGHAPATPALPINLTLPVEQTALETGFAGEAGAPSASQQTPAESPQLLAEAVLDLLLTQREQMIERGTAGDSAVWRAHLQRCLNDERLLNISARAGFEYLVACLLTNGWQPGNESLFTAACQVFNWEKDRRRLNEFGRAGSILDQAIDESGTFLQQDSNDCTGQTDAIVRVRERAEPRLGELLIHAPHLRRMVDRFPAWTAVVADAGRMRQWIGMEKAVPEWRRFAYQLELGARRATFSRFWQVVIAIALIRALFSIFGPDPDDTIRTQYIEPPSWMRPTEKMSEQEARDEEAYKRAAGRFYMPPGVRRLDPALQAQSDPIPVLQRPTPPAGRHLTDAEMNAVFERMNFQPGDTPPGRYTVKFDLQLGDGGKIEKMKKSQSSGLPELDLKVEEAIRSAAPFGPHITRNFWLGYTFGRMPRTAPKPPQEVTSEKTEAPTETP